jgi:hypothetical protein
MKKWKPWLIVTSIVFLLVLRLFFIHLNKLQNEKAWYMSQLHYNCSTRVDSLMFHNRALLTITWGNLDAEQEWKLKEHLHTHGMLHLIIQRKDRFDLRVPEGTQINDSICLQSDRDELLLYRNGVLVMKRPLSESFRQRPF